MTKIKDLLRNQYNNLSDIRHDVDLMEKEISLLKKEKAVLLEAVETGGDYEISGMAKVDFVLLRDSLRDTLEKLKEIRE